jgi:hypothetical protein
MLEPGQGMWLHFFILVGVEKYKNAEVFRGALSYNYKIYSAFSRSAGGIGFAN